MLPFTNFKIKDGAEQLDLWWAEPHYGALPVYDVPVSPVHLFVWGQAETPNFSWCPEKGPGLDIRGTADGPGTVDLDSDARHPSEEHHHHGADGVMGGAPGGRPIKERRIIRNICWQMVQNRLDGEEHHWAVEKASRWFWMRTGPGQEVWTSKSQLNTHSPRSLMMHSSAPEGVFTSFYQSGAHLKLIAH